MKLKNKEDCSNYHNHDRLTEENKRLSKQLTTITAQRDEMLMFLETIKDSVVGSIEKEWLKDLLSTIKEQKDAQSE